MISWGGRILFDAFQKVADGGAEFAFWLAEHMPDKKARKKLALGCSLGLLFWNGIQGIANGATSYCASYACNGTVPLGCASVFSGAFYCCATLVYSNGATQCCQFGCSVFDIIPGSLSSSSGINCSGSIICSSLLQIEPSGWACGTSGTCEMLV